jgi:hypothetical protein
VFARAWQRAIGDRIGRRRAGRADGRRVERKVVLGLTGGGSSGYFYAFS